MTFNKLKLFTFLFFSLFVSKTSWAQKTPAPADSLNTGPWEGGGVFTLNISQAAFSNWAAGGENSVAGTALVDAFLNYENGRSRWNNTLKVGYGLMQRDETGVQKTDDMIKFSSKYGRRLHKELFYSALFDFKTQFAKGYENPGDEKAISGFMAPAYAVYSLGFDYKPKKNLTVFIAPLTGKTTYVGVQELANAGAYGLTPAIRDEVTGEVLADADHYRHEFGGYINLQYQKVLMKNVKLLTKINLFSNYIDEPENIDVDWETLLSMKVNEYISANITTHLIYDDDVMVSELNEEGEEIGKGPKLQFKEVLGIGLSYSF